MEKDSAFSWIHWTKNGLLWNKKRHNTRARGRQKASTINNQSHSAFFAGLTLFLRGEIFCWHVLWIMDKLFIQVGQTIEIACWYIGWIFFNYGSICKAEANTVLKPPDGKAMASFGSDRSIKSEKFPNASVCKLGKEKKIFAWSELSLNNSI